jgi:hypothetical protein
VVALLRGRFVDDPSSAEALVHEVFVALRGAIKRFRGQPFLRTFLVGIAVHRARHHLRAATRRRAAWARLEREPPLLRFSFESGRANPYDFLLYSALRVRDWVIRTTSDDVGAPKPRHVSALHPALLGRGCRRQLRLPTTAMPCQVSLAHQEPGVRAGRARQCVAKP